MTRAAIAAARSQIVNDSPGFLLHEMIDGSEDGGGHDDADALSHGCETRTSQHRCLAAHACPVGHAWAG